MKITIELDTIQDKSVMKDLLGIKFPPQATEAPASPQEPKAPETAEEPKAAEPAPEITISDLRKKGTELTKAGKLSELQEVFAEFGAKKLSGLAESDYPAVMKRLEEL
nr:MAG TPA: hypothetical protein [Caudoviricetes sp.]